jgi:hypothetical protein
LLNENGVLWLGGKAMELRWKSVALFGILILAFLQLTACRHNDENKDYLSSNEIALSVSTTATKQLHFSWNSVGAHHYRLMKNPDGHSGFNQVGENTTATHANEEISVHLTDWANTSYLVQACQADETCVDSPPLYVSDLMLVAIGQIVADYPFDNGYLPEPSLERNRFGMSTTLSGDGRTLAVGDPHDNLGTPGINAQPVEGLVAEASGALFLYFNNNGEWQLQAHIKASEVEPSNRFGSSVKLSRDGNTLIVGAPYQSLDVSPQDGDETNNTVRSAGAVYVFIRDGVVWTQQHTFTSSDPQENDLFGRAIALSGNGRVLCVRDRWGIHNYRRNNYGWETESIMSFNHFIPSELWLNGSMALSDDGQTLAVGLPYEHYANTPEEAVANAGMVVIYSYVGIDDYYWSEQARIAAANPDSFDLFGSAVSLSDNGNILAVGAAGDDSVSIGYGGDATDNTSESSGAVYIFERQDDNWSQIGYLKTNNTDTGDWFGYRVALTGDGKMLAATALWESSLARGINGDQTDNSAEVPTGAVYFFMQEASSWFQQAYIKAPNTQSGYTYNLQPECQATGCLFNSHFGQSLAISSDGGTLAVGAPYENLPQTGAVYLY